jgi:acyl carrier protein
MEPAELTARVVSREGAGLRPVTDPENVRPESILESRFAPASGRIQRFFVMSDVVATPLRIKRLIVDSLHLEGMRPEMIEDEEPLFGEGLGLDSVDALELVVALEKEFGIKIKSQEIGREVFSSVSSLSQFIEGRT